MHEEYAAVMGTAAFLGATVWAIKLILDARTRNRLIDKGMVTAEHKLPALTVGDPLAWLRWGIVLTGAGVGVALRTWLPGAADSELGLGVVAISIGLSAICAYFAGERASRNRGARG